MDKNKLKRKIEEFYDEGVRYNIQGNYVLAYPSLRKAYKLCHKFGELGYIEKCEILLKKVCYNLASEYLEIAVSFLRNEMYDEAMSNLKYGYKVAKFGIEIESRYGESENLKVARTIVKQMKSTNELCHEELSKGAKDLAEKCAKGIGLVAKATGKVLGAVGNAAIEAVDSVTMSTETSGKEEKEDLSPEEKLSKLMDKGYNCDDNLDAIDYYEEALSIARKLKLDGTITKLLDKISYRYELLGDKEYELGRDDYRKGLNTHAWPSFEKAMKYYKKAMEYQQNYSYQQDLQMKWDWAYDAESDARNNRDCTI